MTSLYWPFGDTKDEPGLSFSPGVRLLSLAPVLPLPVLPLPLPLPVLPLPLPVLPLPVLPPPVLPLPVLLPPVLLPVPLPLPVLPFPCPLRSTSDRMARECQKTRLLCRSATRTSIAPGVAGARNHSLTRRPPRASVASLR